MKHCLHLQCVTVADIRLALRGSHIAEGTTPSAAVGIQFLIYQTGRCRILMCLVKATHYEDLWWWGGGGTAPYIFHLANRFTEVVRFTLRPL
jgi:hypothetical protein